MAHFSGAGIDMLGVAEFNFGATPFQFNLEDRDCFATHFGRSLLNESGFAAALRNMLMGAQVAPIHAVFRTAL